MVLLVNQLITPVFLDIANAFAKSGRAVSVFTGSIDVGGSSIHKEINIVNSTRYQRRSVTTRFFSWLAFSIHLFFYLLLKKRLTAIIVTTNPPIAPFVVHLLSRWKKIPYYIVLYDLYPEALGQAGFSSQESFIYKKWQKTNIRMFCDADKIFTLSNSMKEAAQLYVKGDSIKVIDNWSDTSYIKPIPKSENPFIRKHGLEDKMVILYSGNMGFTHDLESVVETAFILHSDNRFQFIFIGEGGKRQLLEGLCREKNVTNVMFLPNQSPEEFPFAMAAADIGIVTLGVGAEGISVPSKTYVNMAAGLCLLAIAPKNSELSRIVEEYNTGFISSPGDYTSIVLNLKYLISNPYKLEEYKANARTASMNFTPENAVEYVNEVTGRLAVNGHRTI